MDSNHRCLDVGQESSPLDHGTIAVAEVGIEPTIDHQALDLAALPVCVLCQQASPAGFEPAISTVTGWRALRTAPRGRNLLAQVGVEPTASLVLREGGLPIAYQA